MLSAYQNVKEKALRQGKNLWLVTLSDAPYSPLFIAAASERAARHQAANYIYRWQLDAYVCRVYTLDIRRNYTETELKNLCL